MNKVNVLLATIIMSYCTNAIPAALLYSKPRAEENSQRDIASFVNQVVNKLEHHQWVSLRSDFSQDVLAVMNNQLKSEYPTLIADVINYEEHRSRSGYYINVDVLNKFKKITITGSKVEGEITKYDATVTNSDGEVAKIVLQVMREPDKNGKQHFVLTGSFG